ncbi:HIRAN domain-containing protein [Lactiplantibacillus modestisalitolerans]|nr:HIRAN domain-containing protein [Lactiplantibacillus modestisalitolerans]
MQITTADAQTYRILAVLDQGRRYLAQPRESDQPVAIVSANEIVQITKQATDLPVVALDTVNVVGERYAENSAKTLAALEVGVVVLLQREPDNQHDQNAISVWSTAHAQIGYVARYQNQAYAELLDQSELLYGTVTKLDRKQQRVQIQLWRVTATATDASQLTAPLLIRQRLRAIQPGALGTLPEHSLQTPLGTLLVTCNGRPIPYQCVALSPWLMPDDRLFVSKRYVITPDWSQVSAPSQVSCRIASSEARVINRWQDPESSAIALTDATSFYAVGLSTKALTGLNDNLEANASNAQVSYRVAAVAAHHGASFMVSWLPYGNPYTQPALRVALQFPKPPVVPYLPLQATRKHATLTREELATLLVSGLPNYQGGQPLAPSISDITVEKLRVTLGDEAYHALANYRRYIHLAAGSTTGVNETLLQALIHATVYHELLALTYYDPTVGIVNHPSYPVQLFTTTPDHERDIGLIGCLAFYNYETFDLEQVPLSAINSAAVIANPEHPRKHAAPENPDWLPIFLKSWNHQDID